MARLLIGRVAQALGSFLIVTVVVFLLVRLTGDPLQVLLPLDATPEMYERFERELGLNLPWIEQYGRYLAGVVSGDLGLSHRTRLPVAELIGERLPATFQLAVAALSISLVVAIPLGLYAAYWRGSRLDVLARVIAVIGQSTPSFWLGLLLILAFALQLPLLPAGGYGSWRHIILPASTLAWFVIAGLTRLLRSSMLEALSSDYVRFARSRGVSETRIVWKHGLKNAALPVLTYAGTLAAAILTGAVVTETVFAWPGLGRLMIEAITARDFPVVQGVVLVMSGIFVGVNFIVDVLYLYLDPRLRG